MATDQILSERSLLIQRLEEALTPLQRMKRRQLMKRLAPAIQRGIARSKLKRASVDVLQKRATRRARNIMFNRLSKNIPKSEMNYNMRQKIEAKINAKKSVVDRLAKKLMKQVRQDDKAKMAGPTPQK